MFCPNCGTDLSGAGRFCPNCGQPVGTPEQAAPAVQQPQYQQQVQYQQPYQQPQYQQPQYQQPQYQQPYQQPMQAAAPQMNWYKFLIYFALFASAVVNGINAIRFFTGLINGSASEAEWLYEFFPSWKMLDIIMGLLFIVLAALAVFARFRLAGYYKNGPTCLYLTYALAALCNVVYLVGVAIVISDSMISLGDLNIASTVVNIIVPIVMVVVNMIYFNKRKALFHK